MKPKHIIAGALITVVVVSVLFLIVKALGNNTESDEARGVNDSRSPSQIESARGSETPDASTGKVIAYYFHGNARCVTCRTIEAYTKEAIQAGFADDIESGRLEWRVVNVEDIDNNHFIDEYQLVSSSVVLSYQEGNKPPLWRNLQQVWFYVRRDKSEFIRYVQDETRAFLKAVEK